VKDIIIIGASGHAKVVIDILETKGEYRIVGLIDLCRKKGERFFGYEILGNDEHRKDICHQYGIGHLFIAIGDNWLRHQVHQKIISTDKDISFVTAVHPSAVIGRDVIIEYGSVVMAGAVVNSSSRIDRFCIINTAASIDHDCHLKDFASVAPNACLGGNVTIDSHSAISIGATVKQGIHIARHTVVGAGATVLDDLPGEVLCYGTPARVIRKRQIGEKYF